ncbi:hypothetical protein FB451DRAFT_1261831 [Mycena latifolia]|nr:hypothetical protein FB451DRAFT_1261831 [Mycena latifolia]
MSQFATICALILLGAFPNLLLIFDPNAIFLRRELGGRGCRGGFLRLRIRTPLAPRLQAVLMHVARISVFAA